MLLSRRCRLLLASALILFGVEVTAQGGVPKPAETIAFETGTGTASKTASTLKPSSTPLLHRLTSQWQFLTNPITINSVANFEYRLRIDKEGLPSVEDIVLLLVQTDAKPGQTLDIDNSWVVVQLYPCVDGKCVGGKWEIDSKALLDLDYMPVGWIFKVDEGRFPSIQGSQLKNYFFCFGSASGEAGYTCQTYSDFFDMVNPGKSTDKTGGNGGSSSGSNGVSNGEIGNVAQAAASGRPLLPTDTLSVTRTTQHVTYQDMPTELAQPTTDVPISTTWRVTVTSSPTVVPTLGTAGNPRLDTSGKKGLPTGAIVGIALGVLVIVSLLACIALFFCLRRRRRAQSAGQKHEQVMLTQSHGENNSQDILNEKDAAVHTLIHPNSSNSNFSSRDQGQRQTLIPVVGAGAYSSGERGIGHERRESNDRDIGAIGVASYRDSTEDARTSPYETHPHQGTAVLPTSSSSPPRRKPTNASTAPSAISALSRNVSTSTTTSRPRSPSLDYAPHHLQDINEESNVAGNRDSGPRYGETRHTATFHDGAIIGGASGTSGGFLSEPGMSAEEVARLEEEERRIDAAIAAADEARERERGSRI